MSPSPFSHFSPTSIGPAPACGGGGRFSRNPRSFLLLSGGRGGEEVCVGGPPDGRGDGRVGGVLVKVPGREFLFSDTEFLRVEYNTVKR